MWEVERSNADLTLLRRHIVIWSCLWWLLLASLSTINLSQLQIKWNAEASVVIMLFLPFCIILGLVSLISIDHNFSKSLTERKGMVFQAIFWVVVALFVAQCLIYRPPAFSTDPNMARLDWGFKYVHVITEIVIRTAVLICLGRAISKNKYNKIQVAIIIISILYTILVVSRSFLLEIIFYISISSYMISRNSGRKIAVRPKHLILAVSVFVIFVAYGNWRQGTDFSIVSYAELLVESKVVAWVFGYFLVNYDNLALIIIDGFKNGSWSNIFGSVLQTLQIVQYEAVDDYLYVGKFNLGTAIRPYILDFGPWFGGLAFAAVWILTVSIPSICRSKQAKYSVVLLVAYIGFCLPIASRIEQPPYLFALVWIVLIDRFPIRWGARSGRNNRRLNHRQAK